jgi:hypothetical protein
VDLADAAGASVGLDHDARVREDEVTQAQACYLLGAQAESASVAIAARRPRRPPACCLDN